MKKLLVVLLALLMALSLVACGNNDQDEREGGYEVTPTDLTTEDTTDTQELMLGENQTQLEDFTQAEALLGKSIVWPEDLSINYIIQTDDNQIEVSFTYQESNFTGRYYTGEQTDMSKLSAMSFDVNTDETIAGVSMNLRYPQEDSSYNSMGVAEGYSAEQNISYMVVQENNATGGELLKQVTEMFISAVQ